MTGQTGSLRYMAPEVFQHDPTYDEKVDLYSAGMILWFIATGVRPFDRTSASSVARKAARNGLCGARPTLILPNMKSVVCSFVLSVVCAGVPTGHCEYPMLGALFSVFHVSFGVGWCTHCLRLSVDH